MNELNTALYGRLSGGTALTALASTRIYHMQAPENCAMPYVVFSLQSDIEENDTAHRVKNEIVYVRAYGSSAAQAGSVDAQVETLLHKNVLTVTNWSNLWLVREQEIQLVENPPSGTPVYMQGGFYRLMLEKS